MADSDPFSGIPLSPSLSDIDTDDIFQSVIRGLATFIAIKVSNLSYTEIARLSDDKLARLLDAELDRRSDDDIRRLREALISEFYADLKDSLWSFFATIAEEVTPSFVHSFIDFIKQNQDTTFKIVKVCCMIGSGILGIIISRKIDKWKDQRNQTPTQRSLSMLPPPRPVVSVSNNASRLPPPRIINAAQRDQRATQRSLSRLPPARPVVIVGNNASQGLNYSPGNNPGFRQFCQLQEVQLHQKGTSRAVFPSSKSYGYRGWEPYSLLANSLCQEKQIM